MPRKKKSEKSEGHAGRKSSDETELKIEISEKPAEKVSAGQEEALDEDDFNFSGVEFEQELRRVLAGIDSEPDFREMIPGGSPLEGVAISGLRSSGDSSSEADRKGLDYKDINYNPNYSFHR